MELRINRVRINRARPVHTCNSLFSPIQQATSLAGHFGTTNINSTRPIHSLSKSNATGPVTLMYSQLICPETSDLFNFGWSGHAPFCAPRRHDTSFSRNWSLFVPHVTHCWMYGEMYLCWLKEVTLMKWHGIHDWPVCRFVFMSWTITATLNLKRCNLEGFRHKQRSHKTLRCNLSSNVEVDPGLCRRGGIVSSL